LAVLDESAFNAETPVGNRMRWRSNVGRMGQAVLWRTLVISVGETDDGRNYVQGLAKKAGDGADPLTM